MDENFQTYLNRAMRMTLPETYRTQLQHIQESPKFKLHPGKGLQPAPFPGYTVITPPGEDESAENQAFYGSLAQYQADLVDAIGAEFLAPLPPSSFHLTLADIIWDNSYRHASEDAAFDTQLQRRIAKIFQDCEPMSGGGSIQFQVLGLMLMTRAIAVCLAPTDEASYDRLLKFRRALYQDRDLMGLGIEQQYYFTPHVTLGYFAALPTVEERWQIGDRLIALNQQWLDKDPQMFWVERAELRKFENMTRYSRESDWAIFKF